MWLRGTGHRKGRIAARDTKDRSGLAIVMKADEWRAFLAYTRAKDLA